ncbi:MAG: 3-phosphoglycerate dehydrogenase [Christensenellales bacterium]
MNNIPIDRMSEKGVVVFNTPGANANAVKELVLCGMLLASRDVIGGSIWVNSLDTEDVTQEAEKGKANFGGNEIFGKTLGVIGLGAIGSLVANVSLCLGMRVIGYDPYITKENKEKLDEKIVLTDNLDELYKKSDFVTLHVPLTPYTKNMINAEVIQKMKDGAVLLNMSRAGLVDISALKEALKTRKISKYVVDFPTLDAIKTKNIIVIPHLGASTAEAEDNCASMAATEIKDYLENGNIKNSVNFPQIQKPRKYDNRYCILYKADLDVPAEVEKLLKDENCSYDAAVSTKNGYGYAIIDTDKELNLEKIQNKGILRIRKV